MHENERHRGQDIHEREMSIEQKKSIDGPGAFKKIMLLREREKIYFSNVFFF